MKILMINGSPHKNGTTAGALSIMENVLQQEGMETEIYWTGNKPINDCIDCDGRPCFEKRKCVLNDEMIEELSHKCREADGIVFASPVYYAHPSGRLLTIMDRLWNIDVNAFRFKPAAALVVARRAGCCAALDVLNKHFGEAEMPIVSSTYWNLAIGLTADDLPKDPEGIRTISNLGRNMAWMVKSLAAAKAAGITHPRNEYFGFPGPDD